MKLKICPAIIKRCQDFADQRTAQGVELYRHRGEMSLNKIHLDIVTGAVAEYAVYEYLRSHGHDATPPDLIIYETAKKSFAADLKVGDRHLHVKSQTVEAAKKYGASWLFQKTDRVISTPSERDYMAFCLVNGDEVEIKAIVSTIELVDAEIWKEPKVPRYRYTKSALYLTDVLSSGIELWRL